MIKKNRLILAGIIFIIFIIKLSFAGEWSYHINDHLGNTRVVLDESGNIKEYYDYYPFGKTMRSQIAGIPTVYKYSGKELDEEGDIGWYYFGARYYDPEIGRFLSVDRFADKYPSLSPYQYAANNPVLFVDVNGDSIWINTGDGNDPLLYTQGMTYEGSNEQVTALINSLNTLNTVNSGNTILTSLTGSAAHYNVQFGGAYAGGYNPNAIQQGSGGSILIGNPASTSAAGHEFFHAFQHESMSMTNSTAFEVGAHLFESHIYSELNKGMVPLGPEGGSQQFSNAFQNLLYNNNFNQQDFHTATNRFLNSSFNPGGPQNGPYSHLRPIIINNPVIRRFYPLVRGF